MQFLSFLKLIKAILKIDLYKVAHFCMKNPSKEIDLKVFSQDRRAVHYDKKRIKKVDRVALYDPRLPILRRRKHRGRSNGGDTGEQP